MEVYLAAANKYMKVVGDHPVGKVTLRHIDKLTAALVENGNSPATVNMTLRTVKSFLRWCADRDELEKAPRIKMLPEAKRFPKVISENDLGKVFDRITGLIKKEKGRIKKRALVHHHRFLTVAIHTGMRRSEIVFLPWSEVDFEDGLIRVLVHARFKVKERREKVVPMHRDLATYLLGQREAAPEEVWLLDDGTGQLGYKRPESMTKAFNRHFRALGLSELGVKATHGNRALMAGRMREAGADLAVIQATLGHSSIQMTQSYFPDDDDLKRKAIKNLPSFGAKLAQIEG
ncbi:MAG: site-specific integrase [SAR324 cluster bacterium]|nr:site-specific integrase [SAR324 cluster bacterium]